MRIKRYFCQDMRSGMRQVKQEQGSDAVILSNRRVDGGIEIVAATDYDPDLIKTEESNPVGEYQAVASDCEELPEAHQEEAVVWSQEPTLVRMRDEISVVRQLLENQLAGLTWSHLDRSQPFRAKLLRDLTSLGLDPGLVKSIADEISIETNPAKIWQKALGLLAKNLTFLQGDFLEDGGVVAIVGPTGVGKTTTIAKLAARFALRHGAESVGLVTTDGFRIGAQEQLLTFGKILGVPVQVAGQPSELQEALEQLGSRRLVLVDTAGVSQRDTGLVEQLSVLTGEGSDISVFLALSANTQLTTLYETIRCFRRAARLTGTIITKLDEATSLGGIFSAISRYSLPIAYVADGQRVPEDIRCADGMCASLISAAVALMKQHAEAVDEEYMAGEYTKVAINA